MFQAIFLPIRNCWWLIQPLLVILLHQLVMMWPAQVVQEFAAKIQITTMLLFLIQSLQITQLRMLMIKHELIWQQIMDNGVIIIHSLIIPSSNLLMSQESQTVIIYMILIRDLQAIPIFHSQLQVWQSERERILTKRLKHLLLIITMIPAQIHLVQIRTWVSMKIHCQRRPILQNHKT